MLGLYTGGSESFRRSATVSSKLAAHAIISYEPFPLVVFLCRYRRRHIDPPATSKMVANVGPEGGRQV